MKSPHINITALLVCALCLMTPYCLTASAQTNDHDDQTPSSGIEPVQILPTQAVVTVNGTAITEAQIEPRLRQEMARLAQGSRSLPPVLIEQLKPKIRANLLQELIAEKLLQEQVKSQHIQITDEDVLAEITRVVVERQIAPNIDEFKKMVAAQDQDFNDIKAQVNNGLAIQKLISMQVDDKIDVNDTDTKTYYQDHSDEFMVPEQVKVSHIMISTQSDDPNADPNEVKAQGKQKAESLLNRLKAGEDFAELAKKQSTGPAAESGGDLGMIRKGQTPPAFEQAAFALKVGEISDVVETPYGYHILKVSQHDDPKQLTYDEVKEDIQNTLKDKQTQKLTEQYINALKEKATIVYAEAEQPTSELTR